MTIQAMTSGGNGLRILVAGAGVMGLCVAEVLARALPGATIVLSDQQGVPAEVSASMLAAGMLSPYCELDHMPVAYLPAGLAGIGFWQGLGQDHSETGFHQEGSLLLAHRQDQHMIARFETLLARLDLPEGAWRRVEASEIRMLEPSLADFESGLYMAMEAHLDAPGALRALAEGFSASILMEATDVEPVQRNYDFVIDCRGYGAQGDDEALRGVKGEVLRVRNREFSLSRPVRLAHPRYPLYIVPRGEHEFIIGATVIESADDNHVSVRSGMELMSALYSLHSSFGEAQILSLEAGIRPAYADNLPRIKVDGNVIRCNGLFRHGFLLAPAMAECVAALVRGTDHIFMSLFMKEERDEHRTQRRRSRA